MMEIASGDERHAFFDARSDYQGLNERADNLFSTPVNIVCIICAQSLRFNVQM